MNNVEITKISESIIAFTECVDYGDGVLRPYVDAYLVMGKDRALLIDCLQNTEDLYSRVRGYTSLPVDVLITHGHGDHAGKSLPDFKKNGSEIYMAETDIDGLIRFADYLTPDVFTPLLDGQKFDIGDYVFETIICSGHTAGSVVFVDREKGIMFSGDSIGSGSLWMQIPGCLTITEFKSSLENLADRVADMKELKIYPGHRNQSPNQLTMPYIHDTLHIALLTEVLSVKTEPLSLVPEL